MGKSSFPRNHRASYGEIEPDLVHARLELTYALGPLIKHLVKGSAAFHV